MSLRCLIYASDESVLGPIQQALAELGMQAESCADAADGLIQTAKGDFQILIADWNLPESAQLIEAGKQRPTPERPLILAVVADAADTKAALRAGANSTLRRPLEAGQVRDTLDMARDLLRAKQSSKAAAAAAGVAATGPMFAPTTNESETHLRAGEFLSNASTTPSAQFQVEADATIPLEMIEPPEQVKPLIELEPMAAEVGVEDPAPDISEPRTAVIPTRAPAVSSTAAAAAPAREKPKSLEELLQSRRAVAPAAMAPPKPRSNELLSFDDMSTPLAAPAIDIKPSAAVDSGTPAEVASEEALQNYISATDEEKKAAAVEEKVAPPRPWVRWAMCAALLMVVAMAAVKVPPQQWGKNFAMVSGAIHDWLNPPVAKPNEVPRGHESFARAGDEYKLPLADPIPDATTDPSEIKVSPVTDPTLKTNSSPAVPPPADATPGVATPPAATATSDPGKDSAAAPQTGAPQTVPENNSASTVPSATVAQSISTPTPATAKNIAALAALQGHGTTQPAQSGIPTSLQSQIAPSDPAQGGVKPAEAALPAIEPVALSESDARALLVQVVPPAYPHTVALNAQKGSVVVAVILGRDGSVQDAKFMQGSLSFARSAVDAVKQWRFKPYLMNGRPVSVQTVMTLTFSPPA